MIDTVKKTMRMEKSPMSFLLNRLVNYTAGNIILPAEGEGRNAAYAASLGWKVSAFDTSDAGKIESPHSG